MLEDGYHEKRLRLSKELSELSEDSVRGVLEEAELLRQDKFKGIPYEQLKQLALDKQKLETTVFVIPCKITGVMKFKLNYYPSDKESEAIFSPPFNTPFEIDSIDPDFSKMTKFSCKDKYDTSWEDGNKDTLHLELEKLKTIIDVTQPEQDKIVYLLNKFCNDNGLSGFELERKLDKILEMLYIDDNDRQRKNNPE